MLTKRYKYKNILKPLYYLNTYRNNISTNKKEIQSYCNIQAKNKLIPDGRNKQIIYLNKAGESYYWQIVSGMNIIKIPLDI